MDVYGIRIVLCVFGFPEGARKEHQCKRVLQHAAMFGATCQHKCDIQFGVLGCVCFDFGWNLYVAFGQTEVDAAAQHLEEVLRLHFGGGVLHLVVFGLGPGNYGTAGTAGAAGTDCFLGHWRVACQEMKRSDSRAPCQWHQQQTQR